MAFMSSVEAVQAFYRERLENDADTIRSWFTDDADVTINGKLISTSDATSELTGESVSDDDDLISALCAYLTRTWILHDFEILSIASEGDRVVSRVIVDCEAKATGRRGLTEVSNHFTFNGEHFTESVEYFDSAFAARLTSSEEAGVLAELASRAALDAPPTPEAEA